MMEDRDRVGAMELAAWIVDYSSNDYIPFPMRKIRHAFDDIRRTAGSWAQCRQELDQWCAKEWVRQNRVAEEMARQKPERQRRCQIRKVVAARINTEQAELQHAKARARERLLVDLRGLSVQERLEHIAWDDTRSVAFYPADLATCAPADLEQLDPVTRARIIRKIRHRRSGPWHSLAVRLGLA